MKTRLVRIGNSRGVRLPKAIIAQAGLTEEVELDVRDGTVIIARTIKGKGVSFMENQVVWHYRAPNQQELEQALSELGVSQ